MKSTRSLLVSWLLGASFVALVTFSFDAFSARDAAPMRCPVTGAVSSTTEPAPPPCPAMERSLRCPATGVTASPAPPSGRCPAGAGASRLSQPGIRI